MPDWPQPNPPPYPADDEGMTEIARLDNSEIGTPAEQAFVQKLGMQVMPDGSWQRPAPPPDVWEWYREHGSWPGPEEA